MMKLNRFVFVTLGPYNF